MAQFLKKIAQFLLICVLFSVAVIVFIEGRSTPTLVMVRWDEMSGNPYIAKEVTSWNDEYLAQHSAKILSEYKKGPLDSYQKWNYSVQEMQITDLDSNVFGFEKTEPKPLEEPDLAEHFYQLWLVYEFKGFKILESKKRYTASDLNYKNWSKAEFSHLFEIAQSNPEFKEFLRQNLAQEATRSILAEFWTSKRAELSEDAQQVLSKQPLLDLVRSMQFAMFLNPANRKEFELKFADLMFLQRDTGFVEFACQLYDRHSDSKRSMCYERLGKYYKNEFLNSPNSITYIFWGKYCEPQLDCQISDKEIMACVEEHQKWESWENVKVLLSKLKIPNPTLVQFAEEAAERQREQRKKEENDKRLQREKDMRAAPQRDWETTTIP